MRGDKNGLGKLLYFEWIVPVMDYLRTMSINEMFFEIFLPFIITTTTTGIYSNQRLVPDAVSNLAEILLSLTSILIGFSVMLVTLLLTSDGKGVQILKDKYIDRKLYKKKINLYQKLHIQFVNSLINEIFLMILVLAYYFIEGILYDGIWQSIFLWIFVFMTLNILFSILRGVVNVYFSYYGGEKS